RFDGVNWQGFSLPSNPTHGISGIVEEQPGKFWFGGTGGLYAWDGSNFTRYGVDNSRIADNAVRNIIIDRFGNKWMTHSSYGVSVFNEIGISSRVIAPVNSVRGKVFFDANQDGQHNPGSGEPGIPGQKIWLQPLNQMTFSTFGGKYSFYPMPGAYQIDFQPNAPFVPTSASPLDLLMADANQTGFDFGTWTANPPDSIGVDVISGVVRCNSTANIWLQATNYGLLEADVTVTLTFDNLLTFISAEPPPVSVQGNQITWSFEHLAPFEAAPIVAVFQTPGIEAIGQFIELSATAELWENGTVVQTAFDASREEFRCSYDPNDKQAVPTGLSLDNKSLLADPLDFNIRFQNLGNDTAFFVLIRDTLDPNLDPATLQILASSHPIRTTLEDGNVLSFAFDHINLLWESVDMTGSQGFVKYRISPRPNLPDPTFIANTAHIYFDFNPAVVTNTTENVLVASLATGVSEPAAKDLQAVIFPNPSSGDARVKWLTPAIPGGEWRLRVLDLSGRLLH
ncbi:MAG: hypothetical protein AAB316_04835, partial [Bacteroidota bacterium]